MGNELGKYPILRIESTDPKYEGKMRLLRLYPILNIIFYSMFILIFFVILAPSEYILLPLFLIITVSVIWGVIFYFIVRAKFAQYTDQILIYEDGLEAYSTFFYGLRGLNGFIDRSRISEIRAKRLTGTSIDDPQAEISILTTEGNSRVIGIRSMDTANHAIERMRQLWGVKITLQ